MNYPKRKNNQFINDIIFIKETIKVLEDTIYEHCPHIYFDILPLLHKAYDNMSLALYRSQKHA